MEYADFYDIAEYGNANWRGKFTPKEIACNAYDYLCEFEESKGKGKLTPVMDDLCELLEEDKTEEALKWKDEIIKDVYGSLYASPKLKNWYFDDKGHTREREVQAVFSKWHKGKLRITHGSGRTVEDIFGLPYTSSGEFAALWNCQAEAILIASPQWKFNYLALSKDNEVVAGFDREDTGKFDTKEIIIGKINC